MSVALDIFTIVAICAGAVFFLAGTVGLLRFPDSLTRLHALTKADNLGLGLIVLGLLPQADGLLGALKLVAVWVLVQLAGATVAQLIAHALRRKGPLRMKAASSAFRRSISASPRWCWRSPAGPSSRARPSPRSSATSPMDCCCRSSGCACSRSTWR